MILNKPKKAINQLTDNSDMKLKITGRNKELFEKGLNSFLNVATMICLQGEIPSEHDIKEAENLGHWWIKEPEYNRFQLVGVTNNNWLNIIEEGENFIVVEFNFRYDSKQQRKITISNLMLAWFDFVELVRE